MKVTILLVVILLVGNIRAQTNFVNVAENKPITARVTCGTPPSEYYAHREVSKPANQRVKSICNAQNGSLAHPPELMVDRDPEVGDFTWWQSESKSQLTSLGLNNPDAIITIDLQDVFQVQAVSIQMGDSVRPGQMMVSRSLDGISFTPWAYKVSRIQDCDTVFSTSTNSVVDGPSSVLCSLYTDIRKDRNEIISFDWSSTSGSLAAWQQAGYVRFEFFNMVLSFGFFSDEYHHYTVRNIIVSAPCNCNGHANQCELQPSLADPSQMSYSCVCTNNTAGANCEQCLPFFNQQAYMARESGCESCFCYGHSDVCMYDADINARSLSLNQDLAYNGGGVCFNCTGQTTGINCQTCEKFYFRPMNLQQENEGACQPCDCHLPGTRENTDIALEKGECVVNNDIISPLGLLPGDCFCKTNVQGSRCDECVTGTFDLTEANPDGCRACECFLAGTINSDASCNTTSGQCTCKTYTTGRQCDLCQDGTFSLSADNPDGCSPCDCDIGGSETVSCIPNSGQCVCRSRITGRQCDRLTFGSYYPSFHSISAEFESIDNPLWGRDEVSYPGFSYFGYVVLSGVSTVSTILEIPPSQLSGMFHILLRVRTEGATSLSITISPEGGTDGQSGQVTLPLCLSWCYEGNVINTDVVFGRTFTLTSGSWVVEVSANLQGGAQVLLDNVVALPVDFIDPTPLFGAQLANQFVNTCDVTNNDLRIGTSDESFCLKNAFSLITRYYDGALSCDCDPLGSLDNNCTSFGGQCNCKYGIGGRRCDECLAEFYGFSSTGCKACDCFSDEKVCDHTTGQCECPMNTAGRRCDRCITFTYALNSTTGCEFCNCNPTGSVSLQCDITTGDCSCKPGVGLKDCSACLEGFNGFSSNGCESCGCSQAGSLVASCNTTNGQCVCKAQAMGSKCDTCIPGSFHLSADNPEGCLRCVCMGISSECSNSPDYRFVQYSVSTRESSAWEIYTTSQNLEYIPLDITPSTDSGSLTVPVPSGTTLFWRFPSAHFGGSLVGSYGTNLLFTLFYDLTNAGGIVLDVQLVLKGTKGVHLIQNLPGIPSNQSQSFTALLRDDAWTDANGGAVTREEFLLALVEVEYLLVSASLNSASHSSKISRVFYSKSTPRGNPNYNTLVPLASAVERCSCGPEYSGSSCETCAPGFHRMDQETHPYLGTCVACECNGHSDVCDLLTGECTNCRHNTAGLNCELCAVGYYGNATGGTVSDCLECPCSTPNAASPECSLLDGVVTCLNCSVGHVGALCDECTSFHYGQPQLPGGFCSPCDCNGNSDQCNPITGECLGCSPRTVGFNCESCQDFTFGDASQQNCQDCSCNEEGSLLLLCDAVSGQCQCRSNVTNRNCNSCLPNYYGFGNPQGCSPCNCNEFGSQRLQCSSVGICTCFAGVFGQYCDQCEDGLFGLPHLQCQACNCDAEGAIGGTGAVCDVITGQCPCQDGVTGRQCNKCELGFANFQQGTCTKCDRCVDNLINSTILLTDMVDILLQNVDVVNSYRTVDSYLAQLEPNMSNIHKDVNGLLMVFADFKQELGAVDEDAVVQKTAEIETEINIMNQQIQQLLQDTISSDARIQGLQSDTFEVLQNIVSMEEAALAYVNLASTWNQTAAILQVSAEDILADLSQVNFDTLMTMARNEYLRSTDVLEDVEYLYAATQSQGEQTNQLSFTQTTFHGQFEDLQTQVFNLNSLLSLLEDTLAEVAQVVNETVTLETRSDELLIQSESLLTDLTQSLQRATNSLTEGVQAFQDAQLILDGSPDGKENVPVPPEMNTLDTNGWVEARTSARNNADFLSIMSAGLNTAVDQAESKAQELQQTAIATENVLAGAQSVSQLALQVVQTYERVVTTVNEAEVTATQALNTAQSVQTFLDSQDIDALRASAVISQQTSNELFTAVSSRNTDISGLEQQILGANETIQFADMLWQSVTEKQANLETESMQLALIREASTIDNDIITTTFDTFAAVAQIDNVLDDSEDLAVRLSEYEKTITVIREEADNATQLLDSLPITLNTVEVTTTEISQKLDTLNTLNNNTSRMRSQINDKMALLREKLQRAQDRLANSQFPARFQGSSSLTIQRTSLQEQTLYDEIELSFQTEQRDGLLFLTENTNRDSFMSLEIVASQVRFSYQVGRDVVQIDSPIDVCCSEWYHILATRYANQGEMTVTKLSTGGASTNFGQSLNIFSKYITHLADTTFFVGGVPTNHQFEKSLSRDFAGCIADLKFNGNALDLWQPVSLEGSISCCEGPQQVERPIPARDDNGVSFNGFGYLQIPQDSFDVLEQAGIALEFRTSLPNGVLFSVTRTNLISYIGIFIANGKLVFQMNTAGNVKYEVETDNRYDDAKWYQIIVGFNATTYGLDVSPAGEEPVESFSRRTLSDLSFPNLQNFPRVILGSSDTENRELPIQQKFPTSLRFAGCMRNLLVTNGSTWDFYMVSLLPEDASAYDLVSFDGCLTEVGRGFGFSGATANAQLSLPAAISSQVRTIQFTFKTLEPNAVLCYSYNTMTFNNLVYIALYSGNIFVQYNVGTGISDPLQTHSLKLNDGQWQTVLIRFDGLTASLKINSMATIYSSRLLGSDSIRIEGVRSFVYLGGVPESIPELIGGDFPVRKSFNGDFQDFRVNDIVPDLNDRDILFDSFGLSLAEISPELAVLPPLPYPTLPPSAITPAPTTCASPTVEVPYDGVVRFGATENSYLVLELSPIQQENLRVNFVLTFEIRAHSSSGVIFFAESLNGREWLALSLFEGRLSFNMLTSSRALTGFKIITSRRYDTGEWIQVRVLRINDFALVAVTDTNDFVDNNVQINDGGGSTFIDVSRVLYVGGVGPNVINFQLMDRSGFDGCISKIGINNQLGEEFLFNLQSPAQAVNTLTCDQNSVSLTSYFDGTGWMLLHETFQLLQDSSLKIKMSFKTTQRDALLLGISANSVNSFSLDIFDGGIRGVLRNSGNSPYIIRTTSLREFDLCDNQIHTLYFNMSSTSMSVSVDDHQPDVTSFDTPVVITTNNPLFIGGVRNLLETLLARGINTNSFEGCMTDLVINDVTYDLTNPIARSGVRTGCPLQIG